jgi:hypothetical protein
MAQKLCVTLAGATISDPYLQILAALLILVTSLGLHAYFQPYEPDWLDLLHTLSIFVLLCTQILSILYLYVETQEVPVLPKAELEVLVTLALFLLNTLVIFAMAATWLAYMLGIDARSLRCWCCKNATATLRLVDDSAALERYLARATLDGGYFWLNPKTGKAQRETPMRVFPSTALEGWLWTTRSAAANLIANARAAAEKAKEGAEYCAQDATFGIDIAAESWPGAVDRFDTRTLAPRLRPGVDIAIDIALEGVDDEEQEKEKEEGSLFISFVCFPCSLLIFFGCSISHGSVVRARSAAACLRAAMWRERRTGGVGRHAGPFDDGRCAARASAAAPWRSSVLRPVRSRRSRKRGQSCLCRNGRHRRRVVYTFSAH